MRGEKMKFRNNVVTCAIALGLAFVLGAAASAQSPAKTSAKTSMDTTFAKEAAAGGMAEVKLGQLAEEKGTNSAVKDFGKRMQTDHSKAGKELGDVASKDGLTLPSMMDKQDEATYNRLSKLSGAAFDRAYARDMVMDHEKDIAAFKKEATTGKNPDVKNFASQTLPTLESHLQQAKAMLKSVGVTESSKNSQY
jgi:putative membrane protein